MAFDFEWVNANLFCGLYTRTKSFFDDSIFMSTERPASLAERALLKPFPRAVRPDILEGLWQPPQTDGSGHDRIWPFRALTLLGSAGYQMNDGKLIHTGQQLRFEIMVQDRLQERLALNYADSLARIGVDARVRLVDEVQYERRRQNFDFDMMIGSWLASASPGSGGSAPAGVRRRPASRRPTTLPVSNRPRWIRSSTHCSRLNHRTIL